MARPKDKGKSRALETSALLPAGPTSPSPGSARRPRLDPAVSDPEAATSSSRSLPSPPTYSTFPAPAPRPSPTRSHLLTALLAALSLSLIAALLLLLLGYSYAYPSASSPPDDLLRHAVHLRGPTHLQVINLTDAGLFLRLDGQVGVDADWILGFRSPDDTAGWAERCRRALGRWGVQRLRAVDVRLSTIDLLSTSSSAAHIATLTLPALTIPLTPSLRQLSPAQQNTEKELDARSPEYAPTWLSPIQLDVLVSPSHDAAALARFAQDSWATGRIELEARTRWVRVSPAGYASPEPNTNTSWSLDLPRLLTITKQALQTEIKLKIPSLPGFPRPGTPLREFLSQLTLDGYAVHPLPGPGPPVPGSGPDNPPPAPAPAPAPSPDPTPGPEPTPENTTHLAIEGTCSLPFPLLPSFPPLGQFRWGYELPFLVSLLPLEKNASGEPGAGAGAALAQGHSGLSPLPIARVHTSPLLLPPSGPRLSIALSGALLAPPPDSPLLSAFLTAYLSGTPYPVLLTAPGPYPRALPSFLHPFLAQVHLTYPFPGASPRPNLLESVQIKGMRILPSSKPNEFLLSGTIEARISLPRAFRTLAFLAQHVQPDVLITDGPPRPGLDNAFARLDAPLLPTTQDANLTLTAPLEDVPVLILPGREKEFRAFVQKLIFNRAAWAGVKGKCAVWARVAGLGQVAVRDVDVEGGSRVGRGAASGEGEGEMLHAWGRPGLP
ncbi:hypothetical protein CALCODRAFT_488623 [Calocera cornea HHB12733]|uniref:Uncharacterized protein n=1 Tax=Calocera cornea HHB12733 TaxID=1353952 RepID=A0A165CBH0_9BASI|nr:hypothetical protein CALCODRAFT_488623 [Calocera cornea HHB12733]